MQCEGTLKIEYESTLVSHCIATSVKAKVSWNKINANSWDGTLFVATSVDVKVSWNKINANRWDGTFFIATNVDATVKVMQRNALCSVVSQTFRGAGTSAARV